MDNVQNYIYPVVFVLCIFLSNLLALNHLLILKQKSDTDHQYFDWKL